MFQLLCGVIFAISGVVFYLLGSTTEVFGANGATLGIQHATGLMWGTALVMFLWFIMDRRNATKPQA
jgi:hypothetical protein